jgi:hypothetical protein
MHNARQEIVEKIVEKEVIKEVRVGISEVSIVRCFGIGCVTDATVETPQRLPDACCCRICCCF